MKSITTLEDAYNLPEKKSYNEERKTKPDGSTLIIPYFRDLVAIELEDETILFFQDKDRRLMNIEYDLDGAYKTSVN